MRMSVSGGWGIFLFGCFLAAARELMQSRRRRDKNIKIASCLGGRLPQKRISFSLFAPFSRLLRDPATAGNFLFSETEGKTQCQKNQKLTKICPKKSTSVLSDDPWFILYKLSKPFFFTAFQVELAV